MPSLRPGGPAVRAKASRSALPLWFAAALAASAVVEAVAAPPVYRIDPERTFAGFTVSELGLWQRTGRFGRARGQVGYDADGETGSIDLAVEAASVDTGWSLRDRFVRGENMLDAERFPTLRFRSTSLRFAGHRLVGVDGLLTLRDVTLPVRFAVTSLECAPEGVAGRERCDAAISGSISRRAFGMEYAYPLIGDDVRLDFAVSAVRGAANP